MISGAENVKSLIPGVCDADDVCGAGGVFDVGGICQCNKLGSSKVSNKNPGGLIPISSDGGSE